MAYVYSREQALSNQALNPTKSMPSTKKEEEPKPQTQQEQVANVFGYAQGTKEQPITKYSQPVSTPKERAEAVTTNIQTRQALPSSTATIPKNMNISIKQGGSNDNTNIPKPNISNTGSYNNSTMAKEEIKRRQNIESLLTREKRLQESKQLLFSKLGLVKTPQQEQFNLLKPKETIIGVGKSIGQFPFNLASLPVEVGGRVGFAIESTTYPKGREELFRAAKETPKVRNNRRMIITCSPE